MNYFVMVDCCKLWLLVIVFECYASCVVKWFIVDQHSWSTHPVFKQRNKPYSLKNVFPLIQSIIKELKTNTARKTRLKYIVQWCRHVNDDRGFFTFLANIWGDLVFYANFNNISVISWRSIYWWMKAEYPEKTTYMYLILYNTELGYISNANIAKKKLKHLL
jgi:hypothetical protein